MRANVITIPQAAQILRLSAAALYANVRDGCPTVERGSRGRGKRTLVDLDEVRHWRAHGSASPAPVDLKAVARALYRLHTKPPAGSIHQLWKRLRIPEAGALEQLLETFRAIALELTGRPVADEELPAEMMSILQLLADSRLRETRATLRREDFIR